MDTPLRPEQHKPEIVNPGMITPEMEVPQSLETVGLEQGVAPSEQHGQNAELPPPLASDVKIDEKLQQQPEAILSQQDSVAVNTEAVTKPLIDGFELKDSASVLQRLINPTETPK